MPPCVHERQLEEVGAQLAKRDAEIAELQAAIVDRDGRIEGLAGQLATLEAHVKRLLAGRGGGHRIPEGQGLLFSEGAFAADEPEATEADEGPTDDEQAAGDPPRKEPRRQGRRKIDTSGLPVREQIHELPEGERVCPDTGQPLVPVGEKVFEEIDYQRPRLTLVRHKRVVYGLAPEQAQERQATQVAAPMPPRPLESCAASATLLAWLLVQKYANHLPLYRQEAIFGRDGLRLPRQTLCDWTLAAAEALRPIVECLMGRVRSGPVMQLDDTPVKCQGGRGEAHFQAYLWTFVNPEVKGVVYRFTSGRASGLLAAELGNFEGKLVGDGYKGHQAAAEKVPGTITLGGCWAHTTRKFRDAQCEASGTAKLFRDDIKGLYAVEQEADQAELVPEARAELRGRKSRPVLATIFSRARRLRDSYSDAGKMAEAIGYLLNQRKPLRRFLEDGRIPLDNNACERAIRPIAVGRRNWLFAGSLRGGRAAAVVYSLIESCRTAEVDPVDYLADVLVRVATHPASRIAELLPDKWAEAFAKSPRAGPEPPG